MEVSPVDSRDTPQERLESGPISAPIRGSTGTSRVAITDAGLPPIADGGVGGRPDGISPRATASSGIRIRRRPRRPVYPRTERNLPAELVPGGVAPGRRW